jgi:DNA-binding response OmpR family regulator
MTFITDNHPKKLPPLYGYSDHVNKILTKPTRPQLLRAKIKALLSKIFVDKTAKTTKDTAP